MELLLYAVIFSMILIVSNATNKLVPSLPLPLIQILLGIVWALFVPEENFHLDTELFLALVIGPLLFREAEEVGLLLGGLDLAAAVGALAVLQLALRPERLTAVSYTHLRAH